MTDYAGGEFNCDAVGRQLEAENKIPSSSARAIAGNGRLKEACEFNANCRPEGQIIPTFNCTVSREGICTVYALILICLRSLSVLRPANLIRARDSRQKYTDRYWILSIYLAENVEFIRVARVSAMASGLAALRKSDFSHFSASASSSLSAASPGDARRKTITTAATPRGCPKGLASVAARVMRAHACTCV